MNLKKIFFILCSLFLIVSCSDTAFEDTNGNKFQLSDLKGRWMVINYWASWCHSCIQEIPELNHLAKNEGSKVTLLGVNYDHLPLENLKQEMTKLKMSFPTLVENPQVKWHLGEIAVVPTTFIINPQGKVVESISGPTTEKVLLEKIKAYQQNV